MNLIIIAMYTFFISGISCNKTPLPVAEGMATMTVSTTVSVLRKTFVNENIIYQTTDYGGGNWTYDKSDINSMDNTGTVLITKYGQRMKRIIMGPINVKWFGAKGDSVTDETDAFNKALAAAKTQKLNIYIPEGVYSCNRIDNYKHILTLDAGGLDSLTLYGDGPSSKITSSTNSSSLLFNIYANSPNNHFVIKNLFFESIHPFMTDYSHGIMFQGTKGQNFKNLIVTGCRFEGFSTTILGQGMNHVEISDDIFNSPRGRDNAQNNNSPAVYIWFFDNNNGFCSNINILNNSATGFSGIKPVSALSSKRPMDGFIYGTGYGYNVTGNKTKNFSEEHYVISPPVSFPATTSQIIISNNDLDGSIPAGSKNQDGSNHSSNYGIRCDASHSYITNNHISNFSVGILVRTYDYPRVQTEDVHITGNILVSENDQQYCQISKGISVQGSMQYRLKNVLIDQNKISVANAKTANYFSALSVYDTDSATVENNQIDVSNLVTNNIRNNYGISYARVSAISDKNNTIKGITSRNNTAPNGPVIPR